MLHYKASEIVQRAMTLANIQNSSFVSATENRQLINDAFWALYQVMIDEGDVFFLKTIKHPVFEEGVYVLPDDFYQLYAVREYLKEHETITRMELWRILNENAPKDESNRFQQLTITKKKLQEYFPSFYTKTQMEKVLFDLLDDWKKKQSEEG